MKVTVIRCMTKYFAYMLKQIAVLSLLPVILTLQACKDKPEDTTLKGNLVVNLHHIFGSDSLNWVLNKSFITPLGDTFTPTTMVYHINTFTLSNDNGSTLNIPNSYALFDLQNGSNNQIINKTISNPGETSFNKISFTIGVDDSLTNLQGLLNQQFTSPMYWGMINGYIHFKLEGTTTAATNNSVVLHVGGYTEPFKLARRITLDLPQAVSLNGKTVSAEVEVDMSKYFTYANSIDLDSINLIHQPGEEARKISENWPGMFKVTAVNSK